MVCVATSLLHLATIVTSQAPKPIEVTCRPLEGSRTSQSPCAWLAEATVDGVPYSARSRNGAANKLARLLVAAELADRPMLIRYQGLAGSMNYRSFHAAARAILKEGNRPLRRVRYRELPEDGFPCTRTDRKRGSSLSGEGGHVGRRTARMTRRDESRGHRRPPRPARSVPLPATARSRRSWRAVPRTAG